jgi:sugar O-acyltransferase (sialic acid O-acetyltransferase NeuD family)
MPKQEIAIYGFGGFGREVRQLIALIESYKFIGYFDDKFNFEGSENNDCILGNSKTLNKWSKKLSVVIAIGNPSILFQMKQKITNVNIVFPNIIHPDIIYDETLNNLGVGNIIMQQSIFTCDITIGDFNVFNTRCGVGHDVKIGSFNVFNPNVQISGNVKIGDSNFFGVNSCVLQNIAIGSENVIGACSLLTRKISDKQKYFGIPALKMNE